MKYTALALTLVAMLTTAAAQEPNLKNIRQLTFGGDNAEAYFSPDGTKLCMQSNNKAWGLQCDQIFWVDINKAAGNTGYRPPMVSNGEGRTTCSYYMPNNKHILYGSTFEGGKECPPPPAPRADRKYLWQVHPDYDVYVADEQGKMVSTLTNEPGYDAEATVSPKGDLIVYTSMRSGDLELWTMNIDGSNKRQVTSGLGYDGGAFFSPDGTKLVFRASRPTTDSAITEYKDLLLQGLVAPTNMEIYVCNVDGSNLRQITNLGKANWAPFFHPSGKKILFSSNHHSQRGYDFQIYSIDLDGSNLKRITNESIFNAFPMFSPDGKHLVWSSNRNTPEGSRDTNVFIADWED